MKCKYAFGQRATFKYHCWDANVTAQSVCKQVTQSGAVAGEQEPWVRIQPLSSALTALDYIRQKEPSGSEDPAGNLGGERARGSRVGV